MTLSQKVMFNNVDLWLNVADFVLRVREFVQRSVSVRPAQSQQHLSQFSY